MLTTLGLLGLLVGPLSDRPRVEIWTDRADDPYATGQGVRVHFRTEQDAYVTILRIDTDEDSGIYAGPNVWVRHR